MINSKQAMDIVNSLRDIINEHVNFISRECIIIASTDPDRIGSYHGGARVVIETNQTVTINFDDEYEGAKKGINLPIIVNDELVCVLGITGDIDSILQYSKVVAKMTEILVMEKSLDDKRNQIIQRDKRIFEIIANIYMPSDEKLIRFRNNGISIDKYNYIVAFLCHGCDEEIGRKIISAISKQFDNSIATTHLNTALLLVRDDSNNQVLDKCNAIIKKIKATSKVKLSVAISDKMVDQFSITRYYNETINLMNYMAEEQKYGVKCFDKSSLTLLLKSIPIRNKNLYRESVLNNLNDEEIIEYRKLIMLYIKHNGSITKVAEELFTHKNTIQYRLNKLRDLIGLNPRVLEDFVKIYIALKL